jgi:hypothetical protein
LTKGYNIQIRPCLAWGYLMAANNLNGDHNNFEIFRQFAQGIDAILKLFLQNLSQAQTKDFTNKKVDELKNFNQLLYQAAEFGAYLEKIIQKQIQQAYYETKLEDFRMMEKEIENTLKEKQKNQLAADDPLVSQFKNLLIQEYNNRLNEINNKIEKVRENIALLDQKITEKYAQIKDDNKLILNNFQILFSQAMQHLSDNPSILIFQIDGEETKVNHNHYFDELQKYIDTNY